LQIKKPGKLKFSWLTEAIGCVIKWFECKNSLEVHKQGNNAKPQLLAVDELDYIPLDRKRSELLFQVFARSYDSPCTSTIITINMVFKEWTMTFNNDAMLTSVVLDRILHRCEIVIIESKSYRMRKAFDAVM